VKKKIWMLSRLLLLSMAGCEIESSSPSSKPSSSQQQTREDSSQDMVDKRSFALTEAERKAYENIKRDLDEKHLQGLSPVSIAKIYVKAALDIKNMTCNTLCIPTVRIMSAGQKKRTNKFRNRTGAQKNIYYKRSAALKKGNLFKRATMKDTLNI
jgi:hypothetical protein